PYAAYYMNQFGYPSYGTPFAKQQGVYGQPHQGFVSQYGDHSSSPALGGFGGVPSTQQRESPAIADYGRAGVSQVQQSHPQQQQQQHQSAGGFSSSLPDFLGNRGGLPQQQQQQQQQGQLSSS